MSQIKRIAILCSGGDCSGMNPAIKQFAEHSRRIGLRPFGVRFGLEGLITGEISELKYADVSGIIHRGGTILRSSRSPEFHELGARQQAAENLRVNQIDALVTLGGDGSFKAMQVFSEENNIKVACIPATIDNDVSGSETALGVDTALNVIRHSLDAIRDTASSFRRAFIVETMGRNNGYLALTSALTSGAEICLIPEIEYDIESIAARLKADLESDRSYLIAVVSEAVKDRINQLRTMIEQDLGMTNRVTVLGHLQRGGSPTVLDRLHGFRAVSLALNELHAGNENFAVMHQNGNWVPQKLSAIEKNITSISPELLELGKALAC